jgi:hypothetical protein
MARFNPSPDPTNDPNYLGYSKGYDQVKADTSLGGLFSGIGDVAGTAFKVADQEIQEKIRREATTQIDALNAQHGGYLEPEEIPAIAGKGSRGTKYAQATETGQTPEIDMDAVPAGATRRLDGLKKLGRAYNAGELSNSYYESQFTAIVANLRSQYPAYRQQIDAVTSDIRGTPAANNLRKSLLADMQSMAAAGTSADRQNEAWYKADQKYLHTLFPDKDKAWMIANRPVLEVQVGKVKAFEFDLEIQDKELGLDTKKDARKERKAEHLFNQAAVHEVSTFMTGQTNALGVNLGQLQKDVNSARARGASPDEIQALRQKVVDAKAVIGQAIDNRFNSMQSVRFVDANKRDAIKNTALKQLDGIVAQLEDPNGGLASVSANIVKLQTDRDVQAAMKNFPVSRALAVSRKLFGETATALIMPGILPELNEVIVNGKLLHVADKESTSPPPPVAEILDANRRNDNVGEVPPKVTRLTVTGLKKLAEDKDPAIAARAVESLYKDPKWFAEVPMKQKQQVYEVLGSEDFTKKMLALGEKNPQAWKQYSGFMKENFKSVFGQGVADLQSAIDFNQYEVKFQPKSFEFSVTAKPEYLRAQRMQGQLLPGQPDPAQRFADKINNGTRLIKPILEREFGEQAQEQLIRLIGLDTSQQGSKGNLIQELGKKVWESLPGLPEDQFNDRFGNPKAPEKSGSKPLRANPDGEYRPMDALKDLTYLEQIDTQEAQSVTKAAKLITDSLKINPDAWENFVQNARQSTNVEDRREGKNFDEDFTKAMEQVIASGALMKMLKEFMDASGAPKK